MVNANGNDRGTTLLRKNKFSNEHLRHHDSTTGHLGRRIRLQIQLKGGGKGESGYYRSHRAWAFVLGSFFRVR